MTPFELGWNPIANAPREAGKRILVKDGEDGWTYIAWWTDDVYTEQGGRGGQSGWFAGNYDDNWGDRPRMQDPKWWMEIPA